MKQPNSILTPAIAALLREKQETLKGDLQHCQHTLKRLRASQGSGGSAEQIGRWETIKENERTEIELESKLELIQELLSQ